MFIRRVFLRITFLVALHISYIKAQCDEDRILQLRSSCTSTLQNAIELTDCSENTEEDLVNALAKAGNCFSECGGSVEAISASDLLGEQATELLARRCKYQEAREGCDIIRAQSCPEELKPFTDYNAFSATMSDLQAFCQQTAGLSTNIQQCSETVVGCAAVVGSLRGLFDGITNSINVANEIQTKACPCATNIQNSVDNFANSQRTCEALQSAGGLVTTTTNDCVESFYGSLKPFRFDVITNQYLGQYLSIIPFGCSVPFNFQASGSCRFGPSIVIMLSLVIMLQLFSWKN